jgi:hypothetical protein
LNAKGSVTKAEEKAAKAAYEKHRAACRACGLLPEHFSRFLAEFVEVLRHPSPDGEPCESDGLRRDYGLQYSGLKGY